LTFRRFGTWDAWSHHSAFYMKISIGNGDFYNRKMGVKHTKIAIFMEMIKKTEKIELEKKKKLKT
jgi:hypothetical protein